MQGLSLVLLLAASQYRGAALSGSTLYTWGTELAAWELPSLAKRTILARRAFEPGGCAVEGGLVLQEKGRAILVELSSGRERVVETGTGFASCLEFTLAGRRGILLTHLDAQLRFYIRPGLEMKELYSIYTASRQGGLLAHDVDGDGLEDLFFGNYWVKNPGKLDVAWRLFAINLWHDTPDAALAALALDGGDLIWAESSAERARIARFEKPADPKQLWVEMPMTPLRRPRAVLAAREGVYIGHDGGVELFPRTGGNRRVLDGVPCVALAGFGGRIYFVSAGGVTALEPRK